MIKEQEDQINKLKLEQDNLNYRHCRIITGFQSQISYLQNKLKKKTEESSEEIILKEKLVAYDQRLTIYEDAFKQNEKESDVFMHLLSIIFPKIKTDKNLDNVSFIKILENKVKETGCESIVCQKKIQENAKAGDKEMSILKEKFSQLESKMTVSEKDLLTSQENCKNLQAHYECLKHELDSNNGIIDQKNNTIDSLQEQLQILQHEIYKKEDIKLQDVNLNLSVDNIKQEEKSEIKDSINIHENKLENDSEIILSSSIEKILLEISNEKRKATEHRKNLNDKMISLGTNLLRNMKRKLIKYRGERSDQIASFEERIKREFNHMMSIAAYEEIRLLESKHKQDKQDINHKIKK